ncbi:expressed unknown protein [Seminavis robusta]|uniref:Domain of unknown function at the cortex 1 domain-containing protein n=1 Tax=Seminavis robusta TaxID=568900 RepID=A0A9N8HAJ9_9STRA|nr:expressed unknown protein [Seminavis robusta]|eukprot:Sro322_g117170.1 n/a (555) ;mRNA; r:74204-75868
MSIGSSTSSDSSTSLEDNDTNKLKGCLLRAERELFRFFSLPLPIEHQQQYDRYNNHNKSSPPLVNDQNDDEDTKNKKKKWWRRSNKAHQQEEAPPPPPIDFVEQQQYTRVSQTTPNYPVPPHPSTWPQRPVFIRASPGTSTHIVGVRGLPDDFCEKHPDLVPVNSGSEPPGHCLIVDFVSKHMVGSLLIRVRGVPSLVHNNTTTTNAKKDYFGTRQRTFQGVIRGRFRHSQPVYDCLSGQTFRRPAGKLPPNWIIKAFQALLARLAPQSSLELFGPKPRSLAPLISTTQTILVTPLKSNNDTTTTNTTTTNKEQQDQGLVCHDGQFFYDSIYDDHINHCYASNDAATMEQEFQEPHATHPHSMIHEATQALAPDDIVPVAPPTKDDTNKNRKFRKRYFNKLLSKSKRTQRQEEKKHAHDEQHHDHHHDESFDFSHHHLPEFAFSTDKEYTFEFYENLVMFENPQKEFAMNLRLPLLRHIPIAPTTDGQPIQMMCAIRKQQQQQQQQQQRHNEEGDDEESVAGWDDELEYLWAFEVWHESLYEYACKAHGIPVDG